MQLKDFEPYGITPQQLGLQVETMVSEQGAKMTGVLIEDDSAGKQLKVRSFHRIEGTLEHHHQHFEDQLRAKQATEFGTAYIEDCQQRIWPRALGKPLAGSITSSTLSQAVQDFKKAEEEKEKQHQLQSNLLPTELAEAAAKETAEKEAREKEDEAVELASSSLFRPGLASASAKAKAKPKKVAKNQTRCQHVCCK